MSMLLDQPAVLSRLRRAREDRGLTQQQVATEMGVARTTVVAIESGERRLRDEELVVLARLYGERLDHLLRPETPPRRLAAELRTALAGMPQEAELAQVIAAVQQLAEDFHHLEQILAVPINRRYPPAYELPGRDPDRHAERLAQSERDRLQLGNGPIPHLRDVLEHDVGLRVFCLPMPARIGGLFAADDALGACVAINRNQRWERQRFSLAHEYAHFLIERHRPDITLEISSYQRVPAVERFAEAFARHLLLPSGGVQQRFVAAKEAAGRVTNAMLLAEADYWQVSLQAMVLRLEDLRLVRSGHWAHLESDGFRPDEGRRLLGLPTHPPDEVLLPRRFQVLALTAFREHHISEGQLAAFLRVDRITARKTLAELGFDRADQAEAL